MAPTKPAVKPAAASPAVKKTASDVQKKGKTRNYNLGCGVYRFSKSKMYHKKAKYKFVGKKNPKVNTYNYLHVLRGSRA